MNKTDVQTEQPPKPEVILPESKDYIFYSHFNRNAYLHVAYCLPEPGKVFRKLRIAAGKTQNGKAVAKSTHYLSYEQFRYVCYVILTGLEDKEFYMSTKGFESKDAAKNLMVRMFKIRREDQPGKAPKYFMSVGHGPGKKGGGGLIIPDKTAPKETWEFATLVFNDEQLITFALAIQAFLNGITSAEVLSAQSLI